MLAIWIGLIALIGLGGWVRPAAPSPSISATTVTLEMREFRFRPEVIRLPAGHLVTLRVVNRGQIAHQIQIEAFRDLPVTIVDEQSYVEASGLEILRLQPGARAILRFTPRFRARVPFACTIEGHKEAGMTGVLEIR